MKKSNIRVSISTKPLPSGSVKVKSTIGKGNKTKTSSTTLHK